MADNTTILPKGTIVKFNGCALELIKDTEVKGSFTIDQDTNSVNEPFVNEGGSIKESSHLPLMP
ncbi:MAG: hypothetical protein R2681_11400 [Pyrinomonadaceae bacterium]